MSQQWRAFRSRLWSRRTNTLAMLLTLLAALSGAAAWAQPSGIDLGWWTIDGGGAIGSTSGDLTLSGTIGQPDASDAATVGGLTLESGFWVADTAEGSAAPSTHITYLPQITQDHPVSLADDPRPDLVATIRLNPTKTTFATGESVEVLVTVTNNGNSTAEPFWVDLYINPSAAPTAANQIWDQRCGTDPCFGIAWPVASKLAPGQSITLSSQTASAEYSYWLGWMANGTTDLYTYVDSWKSDSPTGAIDESNETNNRAELHGLHVSGANPALATLSASSPLHERPDLSE